MSLTKAKKKAPENKPIMALIAAMDKNTRGIAKLVSSPTGLAAELMCTDRIEQLQAFERVLQTTLAKLLSERRELRRQINEHTNRKLKAEAAKA